MPDGRRDIVDFDAWIASLPPRIYRSEVLKIARIGRDTLRREIEGNRMPPPCGRGREALFKRDDVLRAVGYLPPDGPVDSDDPWIDALQRDN